MCNVVCFELNIESCLKAYVYVTLLSGDVTLQPVSENVSALQCTAG